MPPAFPNATRPPAKLRLATLTAAELREMLPLSPVLLLPLGSQENQGPHAPMGDHLCAEAIAERIARRSWSLGHPALVAPVLPFGGADYFADVEGAIALSQSTLRAVLADMLGGLVAQGLTRLMVLNGHGGNAQAVQDVTRALRRAQGVLVPSLSLWKVAGAMLPELLGPEQAAKRAGHGADPLASVAMHLFPDFVRPDLVPAPREARPMIAELPVASFTGARFGAAEIDLPLELPEFAPDGVFGGDPRLCDAATGARIVDRLVELGAGLIAHMDRIDGWRSADGTQG